MLKRLNNITQNERKNKGVVALADRPNVVSSYGKSGLSPLELKVWFDKLGNLLADKINEIHNALNESGQDYIGIGNLGDEVTCLGDLTEMLLNGKFANLILAYNSVADIGDDELLTPLQEIINEKARQISNINESINKYIKQISDIETAIGDMTKIKTIAEDISSAIYVLGESLSGNEIKSIIDFTFNTETGIVTKKYSDGTLEEMQFPTNDDENEIMLSNIPGTSQVDGYTQYAVNSLVSNPNLLINSDFSVNQRGQTEYQNTSSIGIIGVDCWYIDVNIKITKTTINSAGVTASKGATATGGYYFLTQLVEDYAKLAGKTLTVTVSYKNNTGSFRIQCNERLKQGDIPALSYSSSSFTNESGIATFTFTLSSAPERLAVRLQDNTANAMSIEFEYVKLEIGSVATAYTPPIYEEELLKCQSIESDYIKLLRNTNISTTYPLSPTSASDSKVLSEKVIYDNVIPKSQVQNPNILINSNFGINQRGIYTDNTSARFMADRWYKQVTNAASVSFDGEECTITLLSDRASKTPILRQIIEDGYKYVGKSLTFSLDVISTTSTYYISIVYYNADGAYVSESAYGLTATKIGRISVSTNSVPNNTSEIRVTINVYANGLMGDKFVFKHPKLEEGSVATIYVTPIYEEELLKCQTTEDDPVQILRNNDSSVLRKTSISTIYPISYNIASDEKILSEKAIVGKLVTLSEIYSVALSDGDDLDLMVPSVVGQTILYNCPSVGVSNSLSNNPVQGQAFTMYATLNWSSADKLYRRMTQYIITMDGNIWSRGYGTSLGTESTWTNWKKATTYSNEWVKYTGEDLVDGTYSIQITVNSGYRIELGTLNIGGTGASERTSVGIDVYLNTVSLYYVQRENDGTLKVYSCGIGSTTASQQTNILIYYKRL